MDNISLKNSADKINKLYNDLNYYDVYGGSVIIFIILIIILLLVYSYISTMKNIQPIKDNWAVERCNPKVIPFAGFINKPENSTIIEYTEENFNYCMQNILTSITGTALEPITFITAGITSLYNEIADTLNSIRVIISNVRTNIQKIAEEILGRILNIMTPIQSILISFVDTMEKIKGIFAAGIYTSLGTYYALQSLLGAILQFVVMILIILAGLIVGLWILPFTWPVAMTSTAVFLSISIPLLIILIFMKDVLHINVNSPIPDLPQPGHCFDKNVLILMNNGIYKSIEEIEVGDELVNNNIITSKLKLDATNVEMYYLGNIVVSGSHRVIYNGEWVFVKDHPERKTIVTYNEPIIYCLNTSLKKIEINDFVFCDWDEVFDNEIDELLTPFKSKSTKDIHKYYDGGFYYNTKIDLDNEKDCWISNLKIGSILKNGTKVLGLVEIYNDNLEQNKVLNNLCGINIYPIFSNQTNILEKNNDETTKMMKISKSNPLYFNSKKLYHLITNKNSFYVENVKYYHYNSCIELFLEKYKRKLLSMKYV